MYNEDEIISLLNAPISSAVKTVRNAFENYDFLSERISFEKFDRYFSSLLTSATTRELLLRAIDILDDYLAKLLEDYNDIISTYEVVKRPPLAREVSRHFGKIPYAISGYIDTLEQSAKNQNIDLSELLPVQEKLVELMDALRELSRIFAVRQDILDGFLSYEHMLEEIEPFIEEGSIRVEAYYEGKPMKRGVIYSDNGTDFYVYSEEEFKSQFITNLNIRAVEIALLQGLDLTGLVYLNIFSFNGNIASNNYEGIILPVRYCSYDNYNDRARDYLNHLFRYKVIFI